MPKPLDDGGGVLDAPMLFQDDAEAQRQKRDLYATELGTQDVSRLYPPIEHGLDSVAR